MFSHSLFVSSITVYHRFDVRLRMWISGSKKSSKIPPLDEQKAIQEGADLLGETFLLSVATGKPQ